MATSIFQKCKIEGIILKNITSCCTAASKDSSNSTTEIKCCICTHRLQSIQLKKLPGFYFACEKSHCLCARVKFWIFGLRILCSSTRAHFDRYVQKCSSSIPYTNTFNVAQVSPTPTHSM